MLSQISILISCTREIRKLLPGELSKKNGYCSPVINPLIFSQTIVDRTHQAQRRHDATEADWRRRLFFDRRQWIKQAWHHHARLKTAKQRTGQIFAIQRHRPRRCIHAIMMISFFLLDGRNRLIETGSEARITTYRLARTYFLWSNVCWHYSFSWSWPQ